MASESIAIDLELIWAQAIIFKDFNNRLLTKRAGRTGEYWPEVVAVQTEQSEVHTATTDWANIPQYGLSKLGW